MITVPNYDTLIHLPSQPKTGELAAVEDEKRFYIYADGEWTANMENEQQITLFDFNQNIISQMPAMPEDDVKIAISSVAEFCRTHENRFYALLCRDINYYTLFELTDNKEATFFENDLISVFDFLGKVKSISPVGENKEAYEIWIDTNTGCNMFLFFPYDVGVITCHL